MCKEESRMRDAIHLLGTVTCATVMGACSGASPAAPAATPTTVHPHVVIVSVSVSAERLASGYSYKIVAHLKEDAGVAATIGDLDATLVSGTTPLVSSHFTQVLPGTGVCPPNATVDTRELVLTDSDPTHTTATTAQVKVSFSDATFSGTASGEANIPALPPRTYTLVGTIADETTRAPLPDVRVEIINGVNVGKVATTDASGTYNLVGLVAETFRLRASKDGYGSGEQNVTVPDIPRADFFLHQPCAVSVSPTSYSSINGPFFGAGILTLTAGSPTCSWNLSTTDDWIKLSPPTSGTGSSTVNFSLVINMPVTAGRTGSILLSWPGGSTRVSVEEQPANCTPSATITVPPAGPGYMFYLGQGCIFNTTLTVDVPWIRLGSGHAAGTYIDIFIDPNPGAQRIGHVTADGHGNGLYSQYTFVQ